MTLGIQVSKVSDDMKELVAIDGFAWRTDAQTRLEFEAQRKHEIPLTAGQVCLDLIDTHGNIADTITITEKRYAVLTGKFR